MKSRLFLASVFIFLSTLCSSVWAGGELPFPFDDETGLPVVASYTWEVHGTNLDVQVKILQAESGDQTVKIWIRNDSGFVFSRSRLPRQGDSATVPVQVAERAGQLTLDWGAGPAPGSLELGGEVFPLVGKPVR